MKRIADVSFFSVMKAVASIRRLGRKRVKRKKAIVKTKKLMLATSSADAGVRCSSMLTVADTIDIAIRDVLFSATRDVEATCSIDSAISDVIESAASYVTEDTGEPSYNYWESQYFQLH